MSSLRDIVDQLRENRDVQADEHVDLRNTIDDMSKSFISAVGKTNDTIASALIKQERQKLREKEEQKESRNRRTPATPNNRTGVGSDDAPNPSVISALFGGAALTEIVRTFGGIISPITGAISRTLSLLIAPLTSLRRTLTLVGRLVLRGGPLGAVITALYYTFRDIGENETFQEGVETIRNVWNESIVPSFERIKTAIFGIGENVRTFIDNFMATDGVVYTVDSMISYWNRFKDVVQDFVINNVLVLVDTVSGVFDGIALLLEGDFIGGFRRIGSSLLEGINGLVDNLITSVLRLFGADFGEDGSFRTWFNDRVANFSSDLRAVWDSFVTALSNRWNNTVTFLTETLPDALVMGWEAAKDLISASITFAATRIQNGLMEAFERLKVTVLNIPDQIRLAIMENLRFGMPTIELPLPQWLQNLGAPENFTLLNGFEVGVGNTQQIQEVRGRISERSSSAAEAIAGYRSETAAALEELNAARENFRNLTVSPVVVNNVDNSSVTSGSATIRYDNRSSAYDTDYLLRRGMTPQYIGAQ